MKKEALALYILVLVYFCGCRKHKENKAEPDSTFIKYVNTASVLTDVVVLDMVNTPDQGYLILGSSPSPTKSHHLVYLLKIDKKGDYVWDGYLPEQYINPVSDIMAKDGSLYLFCMDLIAGTQLIKLDDKALKLEEVKYFEEIRLPLHAASTPDGGYLVLNADLADKWSGLTKITADLKIKWSTEYYFNENFAADVDRHLKREVPLSFFTGSTQKGEAYYFNGFSDANFSCVFVNPSDGKQDGFNIIGGDRAYAAVKTLLPLGDNRFAISRYDRSGNIFFKPDLDISLKANSFIANTELGGVKFPDVEVHSRIISKRLIVSEKDVIIYAGNTRNKGIGLYAFDALTGRFLGSKAISLETPLDLGSVSLASDGGLLISGRSYIVNRFPRICLYRLTLQESRKLTGYPVD